MSVDPDTFDQQVRAYIYDTVLTQGTIPIIAEVAAELGSTPSEVTAAFRRLAQGHVLVLQPENHEILMANPYSAVPTPFQVEAGGRSYWGNCVWDALGVLAMLRQDGQVVAGCGDCHETMTLSVHDGQIVNSPGIAHFSVPAKQWWDNIVFT